LKGAAAVRRLARVVRPDPGTRGWRCLFPTRSNTNEAIVFTPPKIARNRRLRHRRWAGRGLAALAAVGLLAAASVRAEVPGNGAEGVIIAQGGKFGGLSLYAKGGKAKFAYNFFGLETFTTEATKAIPAGKHQVRMEFKYDGGGLAKGGNVTLYYDGNKVGEGRVEHTVPMAFSADETTDVGYESGTAVTRDYTPHSSRFSGKIDWVQIDLGKDDADHMISPEERLRVAMARQ